MASPPRERLRLADVRRAFRLIGEIREIGAEPQRWRPHLLGGLTRIVDADMVVSSEVHFRTTRSAGALKVIDIGWMLERGGEPWQVRTEREETPDAYWVALGRPVKSRGATGDGGDDTDSDSDDAGDEDIVPIAPAVRLRRGSGFLLSQYPLAHLGAVDQLGLHRYDTRHPFTPASHKLVRVFHVELGRLWKADALRRAADPASTLPPRLTQTLDGLLRGDSEKQIAYQLGLSRHTVHNYIRALHKRFDVSSRAELLVKASEPRGGAGAFTPALSVDASRASGGNVPRVDPA